jgi:outer membrane protease
MTRAIRHRRALVATLILTATLSFPAGSVSAVTRDGGSTLSAVTGTMDTICRIDWRQGTYQVKKLIRCVAAYYHVDADKALYVARRESRFDPGAYNRWSCAKGLYQHLCRYWAERADDFGFDNWSPYNARANVFVTIRMVKRYGWQPWGL